MKKLEPGDRIRLKVRLESGWKGCATVSDGQFGDVVWFRKDGDPVDAWHGYCCALRSQVAKLRAQ